MAKAAIMSKLDSERRFFFYMAVAILMVVVAGFGSQLLTRRVWFTDFPWQVHVHAIVFSAWILLYVLQNRLIVADRNLALHRQLGWVGTFIAALMVPLGVCATLMAVARGSITGVFPLGLFLALDVLHILGFGALTLAAIRLRKEAGWHKRLMQCGTILLTAPAFSRLFGLLHLGAITPLAVVGALALFLVAAVAFDLVTWRRVHPAYGWGAGTVILVELLVVPVGASSTVVDFASRLATVSS